MKLAFLTLICLLAVSVSSSQVTLTTTITPDHQSIKDTKVLIVPPAGFHRAFNSQGYNHKETGANVGAVQSSQSFNSIKERLSKPYFLKKNYSVIEIIEYTMNNLSAVWYELESEFYGRITTKYIFVIGDENEYAMIEAYCPKEYPLASAALKKSMLSCFYDVDSIHIKR